MSFFRPLRRALRRVPPRTDFNPAMDGAPSIAGLRPDNSGTRHRPPRVCVYIKIGGTKISVLSTLYAESTDILFSYFPTVLNQVLAAGDNLRVGRVAVGLTEPVAVLDVVLCVGLVEGLSLFGVYFFDELGRYAAPQFAVADDRV